MQNSNKTIITIEATIKAPITKIWDFWITPEHIIQWNTASPDWHTPKAIQDFKVGGSFSFRMEAKDGSFGFDFNGKYDVIEPHHAIAYTMEDNRKVTTQFIHQENSIHIIQSFEAETENTIELQKSGWQSILDNFKKYAENTAN
ncbi:SRPBCC family protein [Flavobacterium sp. UMI-01]|uniref:SRPBCC family protein n=1 Tax=Flavobacterium sp. UMI-01 TaxID=1441053 RepID=UPI001C7DD56B|nr:SRPBCC family protein [Flavobacterium sp. UMI-01]GIZ07621.1 activator of HSP90 ATPase [Flavobacterium sp. UMI-01]